MKWKRHPGYEEPTALIERSGLTMQLLNVKTTELRISPNTDEDRILANPNAKLIIAHAKVNYFEFSLDRPATLVEAIEEGRDSEVPDGTPAQEGVELPEGVDTVDLGALMDSAQEMNPESNLEAFTEAGVAQVQETELGAENSWDADIPRTSSLSEDERGSWEDRITSTETLQEHLVSQLY